MAHSVAQTFAMSTQSAEAVVELSVEFPNPAYGIYVYETGPRYSRPPSPPEKAQHCSREGTVSPPLHPDVQLTLSLDMTLKNPDYGWIIGRQPNLCDIVVAPSLDGFSGVSAKQFGISWNWELQTLSIHVLSKKGIHVEFSGEEEIKLPYNERAWLRPKGKARISFGKGYRIFLSIPKPALNGLCFKSSLWDEAKRLYKGAPLLMDPLSLSRVEAEETKADISTTAFTDFIKAESLGHGISARVWSVYEKSSGACYALKQFYNQGKRSQKTEKQRLSEMRALQGIPVCYGPLLRTLYMLTFFQLHPHIVRLLTVWHEDSALLLEKMTGNLEMAEEMSRFTLPEVASILEQGLSACQHMHSRGIIHRDLKPGNILFSTRSPIKIKITDFGFAKMISQGKAFTYCGTLAWLAPEVQSTGLGYNAKVDIWSMGMIGFYYSSRSSPIRVYGEELGNRAAFYAYMDSLLPYLENSPNPIFQLLFKMLQANPAKRSDAKACLEWTNSKIWRSNQNTEVNITTSPRLFGTFTDPAAPLPPSLEPDDWRGEHSTSASPSTATTILLADSTFENRHELIAANAEITATGEFSSSSGDDTIVQLSPSIAAEGRAETAILRVGRVSPEGRSTDERHAKRSRRMQ